MTISIFANILICVGIVWIIAGIFSFMQTAKVNKIVKEMAAKADHLYSGKNPGFMQVKKICLASVKKDGTIVDARIITTTIFFKPPKVASFDEIIGKNLKRIKADKLNLEPLTEKALEHLLKDFNNN